MKHIVMLWGADFSSIEQLESYVLPEYDEDGEAIPSPFITALGISSIDPDFAELHVLGTEEEHSEFVDYLRQEYSPYETFAELLPKGLEKRIRLYHSMIVLYGNDSRYGTVNEELFQLASSGLPENSAGNLVASITYETEER